MKSKLPLILILLIGVLTPLLSTALFFFWRPAQQVNIGEVLPPRPLPAAWQTADGAPFNPRAWRGDWVLLTAAGGDCGGQCARALCQMRQLRLMLPGNYLRLRRAWLVTDDAPPPEAVMQQTGCGEVENPALATREVDALDGVEVLRGDAATMPAAGGLYLIDPSGIWAMRFAPALGTYQIRKDVKRLLRLSKGRRLIEQN